jgi:hypothetical protein
MPAALAVAELVRAHEHLPAAQITVKTRLSEVEIALHSTDGHSLTAWEAWRSALELPPDDVRLTLTSSILALEAAGMWRGTPVCLRAYGAPLEQAADGGHAWDVTA